MAKIEPNAIIQAMSGTLGKTLVVRHMRDGSTIISSKPDFSNRKFSNEQLTHQTRFRRGVAYARSAAKTQPIYSQLTEGTLKNAYNIALSDWFNPPVIHSIQQQAGLIRVDATDNVQVAKVLVTISDADGKTLERGQALLVKDRCWEYIPAAEGKVTVEAHDLAGNITTKEL